MKLFKVLAACLVVTACANLSAMSKSEELKQLLPGQPRQLTALEGFDKLYAPAFQVNISGGRARIRNAKAYLNYITILLDTVPGSKVDDLPSINGSNLKEQTEQALAKWKLSLAQVDGTWLIQPALPASVDEAITAADTAAGAVAAAAGAANPTQKGKIRDIGAKLSAVR